MFLVAEVQNKPSERNDLDAPARLRVSYAWSRGSWPFVRRFKSIDQGDPLGRAHNSEFVDEITMLTGITADDVDNVHVSARYCPYITPDRKLRQRVLALYRRFASGC